MCLKRWRRKSMRERADKYISMLLDCKIRLRDVPKSVRMNPQVAARIHTAAFRVDRALGIARFREDLALLKYEQFCADDADDTVLSEVLKGVEKRAKWSYEILKEKGD